MFYGSASRSSAEISPMVQRLVALAHERGLASDLEAEAIDQTRVRNPKPSIGGVFGSQPDPAPIFNRGNKRRASLAGADLFSGEGGIEGLSDMELSQVSDAVNQLRKLQGGRFGR